MKKATRPVTWLLLALTAFFPVGTALTAVFGYKLTLRCIPVFAVLLAVLSVATLTLHLLHKPKNMLALAAVLALVNIADTVLLIFANNAPIVILCTLLSAVCCCLLPVVNGKRLSAKITASVLSVLLLAPVCYAGFIFLIFGNIGQNTVVQSAVSPDGKHIAEVINSDQGALGGDTLVDVQQVRTFDAGIFEIRKKPQRIYMGQWGEAENMKIEWKNNNCLLINRQEYIIKQKKSGAGILHLICLFILLF